MMSRAFLLFGSRAFGLGVAIFSVGIMGSAEDLRFPADAGVIDVTQAPYNARGDGRMDCTGAIQQAIFDHPDGNWIIYIPNGIYRITDTLRWPYATQKGEENQRATILQGQSRTGTVLRLGDFSTGFGGSGRSRAMLWMGDDPATHDRNAVRNLTLHTGTGNGSAIGLQLNTSGQGCVREVTITAGAGGEGTAGIDAAFTDKIGPCLIKEVRVEGFEVGLRTSFSINSLTLEHVEFAGQRTVAIRNRGQVLSLRDIRSTNSVPALENLDITGQVTLLDSVFAGLPSKHPGPAIRNRGILFARALNTPGYSVAIESKVMDSSSENGPVVVEYHSHQPFNLFPAPPVSLGLPVKETPEVPWDPLTTWVSPKKFGGISDDGKDDSSAIQQAIDSGASTVYLPRGTWHLSSPVILRGKVRRVIGCEAQVALTGPTGTPGFRLENGDSKVVVIERIEVSSPTAVFIEVATERTLVLSSCSGVRANFTGKGDVFLEDVSSSRTWAFHGNHVWARQWNVVSEGLKIVNDGGELWLLGLRAEKPGTVIQTLAKGRTELLGGLCVSSGGFKLDPMFTITDAAATFFAGESSFAGSPYQNIVAETRGTQIRRLPSRGLTDAPLPKRVGGVTLPLYAGYEGLGAVPARDAVIEVKVPPPKTGPKSTAVDPDAEKEIPSAPPKSRAP